jgi:hypothetical protein
MEQSKCSRWGCMSVSDSTCQVLLHKAVKSCSIKPCQTLAKYVSKET